MLGQLQDEFDRNYPTSQVRILAVNEEGQESQNDTAAAINDLPLLQDVDANNDNASDIWAEWDVTWRDVRVVDADGELTDVISLTSNDIRQQTNYDRVKTMLLDASMGTRPAATAWQNPVEPLDINADDVIAPIDALTLINEINSGGGGALPAPSSAVSRYFDPTGDNFLTSLDALRVIQQLNRFNVGSGEPDVEVAAAQPANVDAVFAYAIVEDNDDDDDQDVN